MDNITQADTSIVKVYDHHYASNSSVEKEWTELGSYSRLYNTLKVIKDHKFDSTIDVGAGDGMVLQRLSQSEKFGNLNAVEISEAAGETIKSLPIPQLKEVKTFDGYNIPFQSNAFDLATCYHVIEHVEHPRLLLREIARISRYQVFEIPLDYRPNIDLNIDRLMDYGHISVYTPSLFRFLLKSEGFSIISEHLSNTSWQAQKFMITHSQKSINKELRLFKAQLSNLKRTLVRLFASKQYNQEFSYNSYTCFCEFNAKPEIGYDQRNLW
ncbi:class I SAM-dependent methyltransferase [Microcystis aeruginosa EAWAG127a]|uniref:Class I SAM-dependent methyltransferase n=1 Tax=Microcystis aeruginosa EAWAG127a TaxID=2529855 RepID=A0A5J5LUU8_MICAE|nr:class I SAM-dependent methyltransferase [Microcystis aeruginosa]KAB0240946.1 class I SAM-dependent methyltransferase [Microcystis aeruginosa EAWAG127a]